MSWGHATRARLADGRWHFQHGPSELIIDADGDRDQIDAAIEQAWARFEGVLAELALELPLLRSPLALGANPPRSPIARTMARACLPYAGEYYITPMAAVAGAIAEELIGFFDRAGITRAYINNGGDIALVIRPGASFDIGLVSNLDVPALDAQLTIDASLPVRGVATSGWRGRSYSLGIADSVTILARTAADADAAATMVANHVDLDSPSIGRAPASSLRDDSDLGDLLVTVAVPPLLPDQIDLALDAGAAFAREQIESGRIHAAVLTLQGQLRVVRPVSLSTSHRASRS